MFAFHEDPRVIATLPSPQGVWQVKAQRHEVMWRDGTTCHLHPVHLSGVPQTFHRALRHEGPTWTVIDLRHHSDEVEADILRLQPRDTPGVVLFTLRAQYPTAAAFVQRAVAQAVHTCWPTAAEAAA